MSKGYGKAPKVNASFSKFPATECIGAGRLEGWFTKPAYVVDKRGWGHVESFCFEGELFFHLQRSPLLRGIDFQRKDAVTFEVIEVNGRCEAVKLMTPKSMEEMEAYQAGGQTGMERLQGKPDPKELAGTRVEGAVQSQYQLMLKQKWGFVTSDDFAGKVFWHITESPDMQDIEFEREDIVEFDIYIDESRNSEVRAKNVKFLRKREKPLLSHKPISEKKRAKKQELLKNWRKGPPPDWDCKVCGFHNFGRNKICRQCNTGERPPREEWPPEQEDDIPKQQPVIVAPPGHPMHEKLVAQYGLPVWPHPDDNFQSPYWERQPQKGASNHQEPEQDWSHWGTETQAPPAFLMSYSDGSMNPGGSRDTASTATGRMGDASADPSLKSKVDLCISSFNDVIDTHNPVASGESYLFKMRGLILEVNEVLGNDRAAKHTFSMELAKHPWFVANGLEVRYQPSKNKVGISQRSELTDEAVQDDWGSPM